MKFCPNCGAQLEDSAVFCASCGANTNESAAGAAPAQQTIAQPAAPVYTAPVAPAAPVYDHTAEFTAQEISEGKVYAMLCYLMGVIGIIIALLAAKDNGFIHFHVRQAMKLQVTEILLVIVALVLCWTIIVPLAAGICGCIVFVLQIIAFFQICGGKAKEPAIVRSLGFMN